MRISKSVKGIVRCEVRSMERMRDNDEETMQLTEPTISVMMKGGQRTGHLQSY